MTELVALAIDLPGSGDSAAAMVATSAPTIEKMTTTMAEKIAPTPCGRKPPCAVRLLKSRLLCGQAPSTKSPPRTRKTTMAATLMPANQNSNSPNELTENRLVAVISDHEDQRHQPERDVGQPVLQHLGAGDGLEADDDHPEVPVEPADAEARPAADGLAGVVGERAGRGVGRGHLPEHPHHQDDQHAGDGVAEEGRRAGLRDHGAGADEQARPRSRPPSRSSSGGAA